MSVQSTLLFASILFLIVFQVIKSAQSCDLRNIVLKYRDDSRYSTRLGRFTMLHYFNIYMLTLIYLSIIYTFVDMFLISDSPSTPSNSGVFTLVLTLFITIFVLLNLPTLEITVIDELEVYQESIDKSLPKRIRDEITDTTALGKHTRICVAIIISPILPPILTALLAIPLQIQNVTILSVITGISAIPIAFILFLLIDGFLVTLRDELLEDLPKAKLRFS